MTAGGEPETSRKPRRYLEDPCYTGTGWRVACEECGRERWATKYRPRRDEGDTWSVLRVCDGCDRKTWQRRVVDATVASIVAGCSNAGDVDGIRGLTDTQTLLVARHLAEQAGQPDPFDSRGARASGWYGRAITLLEQATTGKRLVGQGRTD